MKMPAAVSLAETAGFAAIGRRPMARRSRPRPAQPQRVISVSRKPSEHAIRHAFHVGRELASRGDLAAEPHLRAVIRADPALRPLALLLLGGLLSGHGRRYAEAIRLLRKGLHIAPQLAAMHNSLAFPLLLTGDYQAGWEAYEWRRHVVGFPQLPGPEWKGEDLAGRTLLVHAEQGLGDCLMLARYLPLLDQRAGRLVLLCEPQLIRLMRGVPGVASVMRARQRRLPRYDCWVFMASLPRLFATRPDTIPSPDGYLTAPPARVAAWASLLPAGCKVGLVWGGNPELAGDETRSMTIDALAPLLATQGVTFVSLQVGERARQLAGRTDIVDLADWLTDLVETAAVVANLDLVIAVDTAVAHLAGALGRPTWIMIPRQPDWRWMLRRNDSPWYASVRLFRQTGPDGWQPVIRRVATALRRFAADRRHAGKEGASPR